MPDNAPRNIDTSLSDRALLVHILEHVEAFSDLIEEFRPLLSVLKGANGEIDYIGAAQLRRRMRRARP